MYTLIYCQGIEYSSVEQVLVFTVEMLADQAYHILKKLGNVIQLKDNTYLRYKYKKPYIKIKIYGMYFNDKPENQ